MDFIFFKKFHKNAEAPAKAHKDDAGFDLRACISEPVQIIIEPGERRAIATGISINIPKGYYGRIAPRSGLAFNHGIDVLAGVVDRGYSGEIKVILINHGQKRFVITNGDRVAQIVITKILETDLVEMAEVAEIAEIESSRGESGFGSSGLL